MLQMYYLRTHVFSKQEKKIVDTAMAFACDIHKFRSTASASPRAVRSILSVSKRNKRKLLLSPGQGELSSKLWSRKRRRRLLAVVHHRRSEELLHKLQHQQHNRPARPRHPPALPGADESIEGRQSGDVVPGRRRWISGFGRLRQLCARSTSIDSRRGAASHCLSPVAMGRPLRSPRDKTRAEVSQREGSHLRLLQSRSLESTVSAR